MIKRNKMYRKIQNLFWLLIVLIFFACKPNSTQKVGIWDKFEITIENESQYEDPFRDVVLEATFTKPNGETIPFWGFYDGDNAWKIRFMPDCPGEWEYSLTFSDGSYKANGKFICESSDIPGLVHKDEENPVWFGFKGGKHFFMRSFHAGDRFFATNWDDPANEQDGNKRTVFLDWFQKQGYNTISVASHYQNRDEENRGKGWDTPALWPLNPDEFQKMETILDELSKRKIIVYPFAGFFGQAASWPIDEAEQELFVKYTIARIGCYWNLLFNVAGPEPLIKANKFQHAMYEKDIDRLAKLIKENDPFGHLVSVHNHTTDKNNKIDRFKYADWYDYSTLQGPKSLDRKEVRWLLMLNHHHEKPLYAQETLWSNNMYHPQYNDDQLRKNAYVITMCSSSFNFADNNGNSSTGFSGNLNMDDCMQERHDIIKNVWDFFESIPYYELTPEPKLIDNGFCLANPGDKYIVYLDTLCTFNVKLKEGQYNAQWINAQNTEEVIQAGTITSGENLTTPKHGEDWLLYLTVKD